jgi:hypothetical protein
MLKITILHAFQGPAFNSVQIMVAIFTVNIINNYITIQILLCKVLVSGTETSCPLGEECCAESQTCQTAGSCKELLPHTCSSKEDGAVACISDTEFLFCAKDSKGSTRSFPFSKKHDRIF